MRSSVRVHTHLPFVVLPSLGFFVPSAPFLRGGRRTTTLHSRHCGVPVCLPAVFNPNFPTIICHQMITLYAEACKYLPCLFLSLSQVDSSTGAPSSPICSTVTTCSPTTKSSEWAHRFYQRLCTPVVVVFRRNWIRSWSFGDVCVCVYISFVIFDHPQKGAQKYSIQERDFETAGRAS